MPLSKHNINLLHTLIMSHFEFGLALLVCVRADGLDLQICFALEIIYFVKMKAAIFVLLLVQIGELLAGNILFLYPIATRSETHLFLPIAKSLAAKGHTVTIVTPVLSKNLTNIEQLVPVTHLKDSDLMSSADLVKERLLSKNQISYLMSFDTSAIIGRCHSVYQNEDFKKLYSRKFDLIFMSGFFNECFEGLVFVLQAPYMLLSSMPVPHWVASKTGLRVPPSFIPVPLIDVSSKMDFMGRFTNSLLVWLFTAMSDTVMAAESESIYRQYLGNDIPGIKEIEKNLSLILSNSHVSLNFARPTLPDTIEVGGIHCRPAQPLPKDLNKFVSEAKDGVIYFSMGSVVQTNTLPDHLKKIFLEVFSKRKERVLWKWDSEHMEGLPPNVKLAKWLPQQDVLGHPNVKLFISHSGLLSTQETVYHGVPVLAIPVFVDQDVNSRVAEEAGFALREEILEMTAESMENKINRILTEPSFTNEVKKMSRIFKDQLQTPLERAVYWVEYCLRHNGAYHLKSPARDLNFIQYFSIDVIALVLLLPTTIFGALTAFLYCLCCRGKSPTAAARESNGSVHNKKNK